MRLFTNWACTKQLAIRRIFKLPAEGRFLVVELRRARLNFRELALDSPVVAIFVERGAAQKNQRRQPDDRRRNRPRERITVTHARVRGKG